MCDSSCRQPRPVIPRVANTLVAAGMDLRQLPQGRRAETAKIWNNLLDKGSEKLAARIAIIKANVTCQRKFYRVSIGRVAQFAYETIHVGRKLAGRRDQPAAVGHEKNAGCGTHRAEFILAEARLHSVETDLLSFAS
jgi:hypothetical protein